MACPATLQPSEPCEYAWQVCCGGVQSAHTAAVACLCAEAGIRAHCLIRRERPAIPSGHLLLAGMFGAVQHVIRAEYADGGAMLSKHAAIVAADQGAGYKGRPSLGRRRYKLGGVVSSWVWILGTNFFIASMPWQQLTGSIRAWGYAPESCCSTAHT